MGNQGVLARFVSRIICKVCAGREHWRGRVWPVMGGGKASGELSEAGREPGHGGGSPKAARFALAIDHEGARMRAHQFGVYGPAFFVLRAEG